MGMTAVGRCTPHASSTDCGGAEGGEGGGGGREVEKAEEEARWERSWALLEAAVGERVDARRHVDEGQCAQRGERVLHELVPRQDAVAVAAVSVPVDELTQHSLPPRMEL